MPCHDVSSYFSSNLQVVRLTIGCLKVRMALVCPVVLDVVHRVYHQVLPRLVTPVVTGYV
jgi:hypothetical protein